MSKSDQEINIGQIFSSDGEINSIACTFDKTTNKLIKQDSITPLAKVFEILANHSHPNDKKLNVPYDTDFDKVPLIIDVVKAEKDVVSSPNGDPLHLNQLSQNSIDTYNSFQKVFNISEMVRCQNCDTNFPTKYQFQRHQCEFNAEKIVLKPNVDVKDVQRGVRMKFECSTCGKLFVSKNNLERHLTSHDEDNVNICEHCNKHFVSENRLRIHKENHCKKAGDISKFYRSDVKVYKCIKCYQVFSSDVFAYNHAENCSEIYDLNEINNILVEDLFKTEKIEGALINGSRFIQVVVTETLLQCEFCNKTFADKKSLITHQDTHTTAVNYNCVFCEETFDSYVVAAKHWLTKCTHDANLFFLPKLTYCHECDRTFKSHEVLYSHKIKKKHYTAKKYEIIKNDTAIELNKQNGPQILNIIEGAMGTSFNKSPNQVELQEVEVRDYKVEETLENVSVSENDDVVKTDDFEGDSVNGKKKRGRKRKNVLPIDKVKRFTVNLDNQDCGFRYQCERCLLVFKTIQSLEGHRDKDHPANYKCEECNQVVHSSKALMIHSRAHQRLKPYVCEICKRSYSQTSHLWQHMRFHQGIKPFACPHEGCEARYTIRPDLKDHIRKVHTRERPFKCSVCNKCFLTGSVYYQHRLIHTNDRRYACNVCNKRFFRADALNNHRRIHTDERPYPCEICGRNFRQKGDRNKHVRTQHPNAHV